MSPAPRFTGEFTRQEPIPEDAIAAAVAVMRSGRLHRYNAAGEGETAALEREFAASLGAPYALACASGGYAMQLALRAWFAEAGGLRPGEPVLSNAFTLSPVPGAIVAVGATPALVETTAELKIDIADLDAQITATGARLLLLSHMRGHICDMDAVTALLARRGVALIEDCAHTMGAFWGDRPTGTFGAAGCFSTQTYKHVNSGEGGLVCTADPALAARMVALSGSYRLFDRHAAAPEAARIAAYADESPNMSGRMDELRAAILRPQLARLGEAARRWNDRYTAVAAGLAGAPRLRLPQRPAQERFVGSSIQFLCDGMEPQTAAGFVARCAEAGVALKWFGAAAPHGYTSNYAHWPGAAPRPLPRTDAVLAGLFDMRLPLTFSFADCATVAAVIRAQLAQTLAQAA